MSTKTESGKTQQRKPYQSNKYGGKKPPGNVVKKFDNSSPICQAFQAFQTELDTKYARHERLVKLSRDVTIDSKKTISMLQRVSGCEETEASSLLEQAGQRLKEVRETKLRVIAMELLHEDPYQFIRAYSPGIQEYVEAVTLLHYLRDGSLVGLAHIANDLCFSTDTTGEQTAPFPPWLGLTDPASEPGEQTDLVSTQTVSVFLSPADYILGVADLTGELMRIAINSIGAGDMDSPFKLCAFIRTIYDAFLSFDNFSRELSRKLSVLRQSLKKVETACYTIQVRGSEIPTHMLADVIITDPGTFANDMCEDS